MLFEGLPVFRAATCNMPFSISPNHGDTLAMDNTIVAA